MQCPAMLCDSRQHHDVEVNPSFASLARNKPSVRYSLLCLTGLWENKLDAFSILAGGREGGEGMSRWHGNKLSRLAYGGFHPPAP